MAKGKKPDPKKPMPKGGKANPFAKGGKEGKSMKCPHCGANMKEGGKCPSCGKKY